MDICAAVGSVHMAAVKANMLLLVGELVYQLKIHSVPHLPIILPHIIDVLKQDELLSR